MEKGTGRHTHGGGNFKGYFSPSPPSPHKPQPHSRLGLAWRLGRSALAFTRFLAKYYLCPFSGVPVLVPVRASPVPSVVRGSFVVKFVFRILFVFGLYILANMTRIQLQMGSNSQIFFIFLLKIAENRFVKEYFPEYEEKRVTAKLCPRGSSVDLPSLAHSRRDHHARERILQQTSLSYAYHDAGHGKKN